MNPTIVQIEDNILQVLGDIGYVKTLESYQGTLEDVLENPEAMITRFPAILVAFGGNRYNTEGYPTYVYRRRMQFNVIVGSNSLRGEKERRRGREGSYQMLTDVRDLLAGNNLGLQISPLIITSEDPIFNGKINGRFISIYAATYEMDMDYTCIPS